MFVGNLNYYPNEDAVVFFINQVFPHLGTLVPRQFRLTVVGPGNPLRLKCFQGKPECHFVGYVDDVAPYYQQADIVIVPVRAGGGTRIKALEAFSFKRPVVSTTIGVDGLSVKHNTHVLIADRPEDFASQCARLMTEPQLSEKLTFEAFGCLVKNYTLSILREKLAMMLKHSSDSL